MEASFSSLEGCARLQRQLKHDNCFETATTTKIEAKPSGVRERGTSIVIQAKGLRGGVAWPAVPTFGESQNSFKGRKSRAGIDTHFKCCEMVGCWQVIRASKENGHFISTHA